MLCSIICREVSGTKRDRKDPDIVCPRRRQPLSHLVQFAHQRSRLSLSFAFFTFSVFYIFTSTVSSISLKHKNQDTVTVQAFYLSNPHKLMDIRQSGPLLKAAAHTGQCTPTHLHKSFLSQSLYFKVSIDLLALVPPPSFPRLQSNSLHSKSFLYLPYST